MEIGPGLTTTVGQIRICIETVEALAHDADTKQVGKHYKGCREKINDFLAKHTSSASLSTCLQDIKDTYKFENMDKLSDVVLRLSFEEQDELHAIIIILKDIGQIIKTIGLVKKNPESAFIVIDCRLGFAFECKNLDVDVQKMLQTEEIPFGFLLCLKKKEEPQKEEPKEEKPKEEERKEAPKEECKKETPKKRRKLVAPKIKKNSTVDATSEESTNK
jgi:hypothetical protein